MALTTAALGFTLLTPTAAQAEETVLGNYTTVFNYTKPTGPSDTAISTNLGALIDRAKPGSTLYMSMYWLNDPNGIEAKLLAAHARNVTVKVVIEKPTADLHGPGDALRGGLTGASKLTECVRGCLDNPSGEPKAINHNKFVVFDALNPATPGGDAPTNVVWQSSQNMNPGQNGELNNAVVISGDASLAVKYRAAFNRQVDHKDVKGTLTYNSTYDAPNAPVEPIFFPRDTGTSPTDTGSDYQVYGNPDIVAHQIEKVDCTISGSIRLSTSSLNGQSLRPAIYTALKNKRAAGCAVDALVRDQDGLDQNAGVNDMTGINVNAYGMRPGGCRYSARSCHHGTTHSKYLLTEWKNADGKRVQNTYTGSHNFTKGALVRNDETLLRISDPAVYDEFVASFNRLRTAAIDIDAAKYGSIPQHYSRVNAASAGDQHDSATASNGSGTSTYHAVVYEDGDNHDPADRQLGTNVYIRTYENGAPNGNEKRLSVPGVTGTTWSHQKPDVGVDQNGNAIVVWAGDDDGNKYANIEVRKIDQAGNVTVLPRPHASGDGHQLRPTVAVADDGSYTVAWEDTADRTTLNQVKASGWTAAGTRRHPDVQVSTINAGATAGSNRRPDAATDGAGNTAIVWEEDADGNGGLNIGLAKLDSAGGFAVPRKLANAETDGQQTAPAVAQTADGHTVATWADSYLPANGIGTREPRVRYRTFSATGTPVAVEVTVTKDPDSKRGIGDQTDPDVAVSDSGDFVVAWQEAFVYDGKPDVWARGFNADGTTAGRLPATRMNVVTGNEQTDPAVSLAPNGRLALTYSDDYNSPTDPKKSNELRLRDGFLNK